MLEMRAMAQTSFVSRDADVRISPVRFGTIVFLASETLLFGGLFAAYFTLRAQTDPWPPEGSDLDVTLAAVATAVLIVSSLTFHLGARAAERGSHPGLRGWILCTLALGLVFLGLQTYDYLHLSFEVSDHAYGTMYWSLTGLHFLHVLAGAVLMVVVLGRAAQGAFRHDTDGLHAIGYYWHFVDVVWIALFLTLFVLQ
jgi:cytochrome c oxidase subunit III